MDKRSIEWSAWKITFNVAGGSWFRRVTSENTERFRDENVNVTKSRRSPETGERGLGFISLRKKTLQDGSAKMPEAITINLQLRMNSIWYSLNPAPRLTYTKMFDEI